MTTQPSPPIGPALDEIGGLSETPPPAGDRRTVERLAGGGFAYLLLDENVRIEARDIRREHGQAHAVLTVVCQWAGTKNPVVEAHYNLSSQPTRNGIAKYCRERTHDKAFDWHDAIDSACIAISVADRTGGAAPIVLDDAPDVGEHDLDVYGLKIPADAASMLIAHGDSMKSLCLLLALGTIAQRARPVLYLDFEWSAERHRARKRRLLGPDRLPHLHYLNCRGRSLAIMRDDIARFCDTHQIELIAVDSVGLAADGKLADDDTAIRFHRALASLPPAMCAAHVPKSTLGPDAKGDALGPFGSVFFSNLCRSTWLVKKQPGATPDVVAVGLLPQKQNDGARQRPIGLQFTFAPERIHVRPVDLAGVEGLADGVPLAARIEHALKRGPLTCVQLAEETGAKPDSIEAIARDRRRFAKVSGPDNVFRIALLAQSGTRPQVSE